nr:retrotransposon protein, putative, Ty1-copia subclass [Tanacetum cinerariifolium]
MLRELKTLFAQQAEQELLQTRRDFHSCRQEEGQSVSSYVLKMKGYIDNLERLGHPVTLGLGVSLILIGLHKECDGFVQNYNMHSMGKIVNELHAMLKLYEQTLPKNNTPALNTIRAGKVQKGNKHKKLQSQTTARGQNHGKGTNKQAYAPKPKIPPLPKREDPAKDLIYHECGQIGQWKRNCPQYLAKLLKKKRTQLLELVVQGLRESKKLKPGALSLYVGNGQREAVEAIGTFYLCLPSGLEIVLNNCHYAPSITRGVIFVSRLYEDGFVNRFMARKPYTHKVERAKDLLGQIHTNVCSPFKIMSRQGASYFVTFTDDFSHYGYVYSLKHKHEVFETFKVFQKEVENQLGKTIKSLRSDHEGEYMSQEFLDHLKDHGIIAHQRRNRTLLDMVRSMMCQTTLPKTFWDYSLETVARILNMVPTKKVEKTPYEVWHEKAPKLSYLKVWGCEALVKRDTLTKPDKLEPRSIKCIFVGYPKETMGYSFYYPSENKVLIAQNAEFLENSLINQEASGSLEDLEIIQEEDTHPSIDTSLNHEEDGLEIDEPQSDIVPIRRSTRTRHAPDRMCSYIDADEHKLGDLGEPTNYKATLLDPESEKCLNAMNVEMQSMKDIEVWVLVELPLNRKTVGSKWLFKKKTDMDGNVHTYKARFVAKGYTQTLWIEYEETFSPVADIRAIRILIAIVAYYDYEILQMDVKTTFLNGYHNEEVYMEQPEGKAAYIPEIKIYRDRSRRLISLCQSAYIEKILKRFCMENSKRGSIPMREKLKLSKSQDASTPAELKRMQNVPYASTVGSIMYAMRCTRLDVAFAQNVTSRFQHNPEAEYIAAFDASKEAVWVRKFISGLGVVPII